MRKIFLACPYGHSEDSVVEERFNRCNEVAATIVVAGHAVFSQVTMSHPINRVLQGYDRAAIGKLWAPIDAAFMEMLDELVVLDLEGWEQSAGIRREIDYFKGRGRKVSVWSEAAVEFPPAA